MSAIADRLDPEQAARLRAVPDPSPTAVLPNADVAGTALKLRESLNEFLAKSSLRNPYDIAEVMLGGWDDQECRVMLTALLPGFVRDVLEYRERESQRAARKATVSRVTTPQRVASWYEQTLATYVSLGDSGWKYLAHCSVQDLFVAAGELCARAKNLQTEAARLTKLAELLADRRGKTVGDLSEADLRSVMTK